jgi:formylglycine-generating enzyme required for sulfatase activity
MLRHDLQDRVAQLQMTLPAFSTELRFAVQYIQSDPKSSLTKSRIVMEKLVLQVYTAEMGHEPRKSLTGGLLGDNQFTRKIEPRIVKRMNSVRDFGNLGPHPEDAETSDAVRVLDDLCEVLEWYLRRYGGTASGVSPTASPAPPPVPPEPPPAPVIREPVRPKLLTNSIGMQLALIPAGTFLMGSPDSEAERLEHEGPQHQVTITKPFYLDIYPVTQQQYAAVMGANPAHFHEANGDGPDHPVENVSWDDAVEFCKLLSDLPQEQRYGRVYGLPTEAEWEYACRGGASFSFPFHYGASLSSTQANFDGNYPYGGAAKGPYLKKTGKVGSYKPNDFGLFDMHGNVWEWCLDWYGAKYYASGENKDPQGPKKGAGRVLRGGSWFYSAWSCRAAYRYRSAPGRRFSFVGFRARLRLD